MKQLPLRILSWSIVLIGAGIALIATFGEPLWIVAVVLMLVGMFVNHLNNIWKALSPTRRLMALRRVKELEEEERRKSAAEKKSSDSPGA